MCEDALNGDPTAKERCEKHWLRDVKRIMQRRKRLNHVILPWKFAE